MFFLFLVISILLPVIYLTISFAFNKKDDFDFRNHFSYEIYLGKSKGVYFLLRVLSALSVLSLLLSGIYGLCSSDLSSNDTTIFYSAIILLSSISAITIFFLGYVDLSYSKIHLALFLLGEASSIVLSSLLAFQYIAVYQRVGEGKFLIVGVLSCLIGLSLLCLIINPKLKDWAKLEKKVYSDGQVSFIRPKRFVLPYSEWLHYVLAVFLNVVCLCAVYFVSLYTNI